MPRIRETGDGLQLLRGLEAITSVTVVAVDVEHPARGGLRDPDSRVVPHSRRQERGIRDSDARRVVFLVSQRIRESGSDCTEQLLDFDSRGGGWLTADYCQQRTPAGDRSKEEHAPQPSQADSPVRGETASSPRKLCSGQH